MSIFCVQLNQLVTGELAKLCRMPVIEIQSDLFQKDGLESAIFLFKEIDKNAAVKRFENNQEVGGNGNFAFVRGSFMLKFQYDGDSFSGVGDYMSLMRCLPEGEWRISHRLWNDHPPPSH